MTKYFTMKLYVGGYFEHRHIYENVKIEIENNVYVGDTIHYYDYCNNENEL